MRACERVFTAGEQASACPQHASIHLSRRRSSLSGGAEAGCAEEKDRVSKASFGDGLREQEMSEAWEKPAPVGMAPCLDERRGDRFGGGLLSNEVQ